MKIKKWIPAFAGMTLIRQLLEVLIIEDAHLFDGARQGTTGNIRANLFSAAYRREKECKPLPDRIVSRDVPLD
jgi:hypothetical protein